jgi:hypothetical protein
MFGVFPSAREMQGDVRLIAYHPTIVSGRDVENISRLHLDNAAVVHGGGLPTGDDHAYVLHAAAFAAGRCAYV